MSFIIVRQVAMAIDFLHFQDHYLSYIRVLIS
jgi:hypothetical protein